MYIRSIKYYLKKKRKDTVQKIRMYGFFKAFFLICQEQFKNYTQHTYVRTYGKKAQYFWKK